MKFLETFPNSETLNNTIKKLFKKNNNFEIACC